MKHFVVLPNEGTSVHLGGGCGLVHEGEGGIVEICDTCLLPAVAAGFETQANEEPESKPKGRRAVKDEVE